MKKKIAAICVLLLIFCSFFAFEKRSKTLPSFKILKVVEADTFYIDFNKNNKIDKNELVQLKNVSAFKPALTKKEKKNLKYLSLDEIEYLKTGFLAQNWAKENLTNKVVKVDLKGTNSSKPFCTIYFENKNLSVLLLEKGFAFVKLNSISNYLFYQNIFKIKQNAKALSNDDFLILNKTTGFVHKLDCKSAKLINEAQLISIKQVGNFKPCPYCINSNKLKIKQETAFLKSKGSYLKSVYKKFKNIELFLLNPYEFSKPSTAARTKFAKRIIEEINSANSTIDLALYGFGEQKDIIEALIKARKRNVKIRSVVDYSKSMDNLYPLTGYFIKEFNSKTDATETIMHNKFIIIDNKKVITATANISSTGSGGYNSNNALIINSDCLAKIYLKEFEQMYFGKFQKSKAKIKETTCLVDNTKISAYFSPKSDFYNEKLFNLIADAKSEIFVSAFYLTDKRLINELIQAHNKGIKVFVLMDALGAINFKNRIDELRKSGIKVKIENWGGKNHEKTMVIDRKIFITGSANFSYSGFFKNDENILVIENHDISELYRDYFLFLFNKIDNKFLKLYPRSEGKDSINSCFDGIDNNFDGKIDLDDDGCK